MKKQNIVLIGFMGSGKSLISRHLAKLLNKKRVSLDDLIEQKEGRKITEIFKESGEPYFRQVESAVIQEISEKENVVIDCGGGAVINPKNVENLKAKGVLVYLSASPEVILKRVKKDTHRPLLNVENPQEKIKELLEKRKSFYKQADFEVNTDEITPEEICREIILFLEK
ncbi:MAG: shikimate kinase [Candidatus Omnitrophica bacterium]|nr:shikimate kinase [Candidatus Omnitrophota bacterium]